MTGTQSHPDPKLDTPASSEAQPKNSGSTRSRQGPQLDTWPFWAPSQAESVERALDLADVGPGTHLVDLGCGDGQVLLAAARRGATVSGVEADPELVDEARTNLAGAGVDADVRVGDLFDPDFVLDADVYFTYLAPATLQRLWPRLEAQRGRRLVTVDFAVPGRIPTRRDDSARLYLLPARRRPLGPLGWPTGGTLVSTVPDHQSLTCLDLVHPGGTCDVQLTGGVADIAGAVAGADALDGPAELAVDLRWEPEAAGTVAGGAVRVAGVEPHALFVVFTDDEEEGMWELTAGAAERITRALRRRTKPTTLEELLAAADG